MNVVAFSKPTRPSSILHSVILVTGGKDHDGCSTWFFVKVPSAKLRAFERELKSGKMNLNDFGDILDSGYGEYPPAYVVTEMQTHFGYKG
jgi:hypothetical protein